MPFICTYKLNNGAIQESDEVVFQRYVDESFGKYNTERVKIAEVLYNKEPAFIYSNSPGFASTKGALKIGEEITPETKIAYFAADGEDIPYERPYAIISFE
jgi:hypothetical protein